MKKTLKVTEYVLLGLLVFLIGILLFFNAKYNGASATLKHIENDMVHSEVSFFHFEFEKDSTSQWAILPMPKKIVHGKGNFDWPREWRVETILPNAQTWVDEWLTDGTEMTGTTAPIQFVHEANLSPQGYELEITTSGVQVRYAAPIGAYYAVVTLYHLKRQYPEAIESVMVSDEPDMAIRGAMLDISRDKVPQMRTLKTLIDKLSLLKYNHLQLYVEGFSFGYPSFKELWEGKETPITPAEIQELDSYCKARFIELVPNQNSLGHMQAWLDTEQFAYLAECPDGYEIMPTQKMKTTLDPTNPESIALIESMMKDLLPNFSSDKFNANLDEPFELGHCNSAELAEEIGIGQLYLDFVLKVYELAKTDGKEFWMWGDIISKHPALLDQLPKDITILEWGYEAEHPFANNTARIKEQGLDFLVCPGTSSWSTLTGRTDNMLGNIENAVFSGLKNGARGMLLTDWGDMGHWQYLPVSYPGMAYAGAISWNSASSRNLPLERYMNTYMLGDSNQELAGILMNMGRSYHFEETHLPNMSHNFMAYQLGFMDPVLEKAVNNLMEQKLPEFMGDSVFQKLEHRFTDEKTFEFEALNVHLDNLEADLNLYSDERSFVHGSNEIENSPVRNELRNGIQMVRLGAEIRNFNRQKENWASKERIAYLTKMKERLASIQKEHRRLWLLRNREGGLDRSMKTFVMLESEIDRLITIENSSDLSKKAERLKEKVVSGAASWFLEE